ncbi:unnamed protein product [Rotaria sp. Silwood2]|nr:unnamed protein product [Rotaria sp. Silwood2]
MFDYFSRSDITRIRCHADLLHLIVCNGLDLWIEKKETSKTTTNDTNPYDSELHLSDSLQKVNIIDDDQSMNEVRIIENDGEFTEINDENGDSDEEGTHNNINQDDNDGSCQNNFEVGVDVHPSESSDLSLPQPDPRIYVVVNKTRQLLDIIKNSSILSSFMKKKKYEYNQYNDSKIKCSLLLDIRNRWNSTYKIYNKKQQQRLSVLELTSDYWYIIELLIKILKPFYRATKALSDSDYPTIGITLFIFRHLEKDFLSNISPTDDPLFNNMKKCLLSKMIYYNIVKDPSQTKTIVVSCL